MDQRSSASLATYTPMNEVVYRHLRDAIVHGDLAAGSRIPQAAIAEQLGVSRMPLRGALARLQEIGLVIVKPHRGAFVTEMSVTDIKHLYDARLLLEAANAAEAAVAMDTETLGLLDELLKQARAALDASDYVRLAETNALFHRMGYAAAHNHVLERLIDDLRLHCQRYRLLHAALDGRVAEALHEHEQMLEAWKRGDPQAARYWTELNLRNSARALIESTHRLTQDSEHVTIAVRNPTIQHGGVDSAL